MWRKSRPPRARRPTGADEERDGLAARGTHPSRASWSVTGRSARGSSAAPCPASAILSRARTFSSSPSGPRWSRGSSWRREDAVPGRSFPAPRTQSACAGSAPRTGRCSCRRPTATCPRSRSSSISFRSSLDGAWTTSWSASPPATGRWAPTWTATTSFSCRGAAVAAGGSPAASTLRGETVSTSPCCAASDRRRSGCWSPATCSTCRRGSPTTAWPSRTASPTRSGSGLRAAPSSSSASPSTGPAAFPRLRSTPIPISRRHGTRVRSPPGRSVNSAACWRATWRSRGTRSSRRSSVGYSPDPPRTTALRSPSSPSGRAAAPSRRLVRPPPQRGEPLSPTSARGRRGALLFVDGVAHDLPANVAFAAPLLADRRFVPRTLLEPPCNRRRS